MPFGDDWVALQMNQDKSCSKQGKRRLFMVKVDFANQNPTID